MKKKEPFIRKYFSLGLALICISVLASCGAECYEDQEPRVFIEIKNSCLYKQVDAEGMLNPLEISNYCPTNTGSVEITLPISEERKTYFLTDGDNVVDSFTIQYEINEYFQGNGCGYVLMLQNLSADSSATSLPFIYQFDLDSTNADTIHPYISYTTFTDYMDFRNW